MRSPAVLLVLLLVALLPAAAHAAPPDLDGVSGPRAAAELDLAGTWDFTPRGQAKTTIEVPGGGWYKQGFDVPEATYSRTIQVPDVGGGQVTRLELGAVNHEATVFVDGKEVGRQTTSYTPQVHDLSGFVRPGGTHELKIVVKGRQGLVIGAGEGSPTVPGYAGPTYLVPTGVEWSEGIPQGIFRSAKLRAHPSVHVVDAHVRPSVSTRTLAYDVWIRNAGEAVRTMRLDGALKSASGADWRYPELPQRTVDVPARETKKVTVEVPWELGRDSWWWPNVPYRPGYRAQLHDLRLTLSEPSGPAVEGRRCASRRRFRIHLRKALRRATVTVAGKPARVKRRRGRLTATVDLRGLPRGRFSVKIRGVTRSGRRVRSVRRYRTCAPGTASRATARAADSRHEALYRFGFRESRQVGTHYELNGVRVNYRGDSLGEGSYDRIDHNGKGDAFHTYPGFLPPSDGNGGWPQAVANYQRLNMSTVRIHQVPASPYMLDVADETGLIIIGETAIRGSQQRQDFAAGRENMVSHARELVERDRNHASVLRWSQSNEPDVGRGDSVEFERELYDTIMATDPTKPISIDVSSNSYDEIKEPNFSTFQHYVNQTPPFLVGGYTDDVHPRDDRPFGKGEFLWPLSATPQVFTWFGTATQKMREKDASDIRPYAMASTWPAVVPGVKSTDYLTEENTKILYGEDNLPDPWSNPIIRRVQQGFHPLLVADSEFWEQHKLSDPSGSWPTPTRPSILRAGEAATRRLVVFNDTFAGERVDVTWQAREGSPDGPVVQEGSFGIDVPLGSRATQEITFTPKSPGTRLYLVLSASKPGEGELFRETEQVFDVSG